MCPVRRHPFSRSKQTARRDLSAENINHDDADRVREEFISQVREADEGFTDDLRCIIKMRGPDGNLPGGHSIRAETTGRRG